jgi:hypothetical protein
MQAKTRLASNQNVQDGQSELEKEFPPDPLGKNWRALSDEEIKKTPISELYRRLSVLRDRTHARKIPLRLPRA